MSKAVRPPVIAGKYTLLRKLGAGGMAEVFLAKQQSDGGFEKLVVIKRIIPHLASGPGNADFLAMFLDEARLASDLRHPNVVTIIDVGKSNEGRDSGGHFIVMEFLHGQDVRKLQRKNAAWGELVPIGHACQIVIDAAAGLNHAHKKRSLDGKPLEIVHRDVSPQNIIVTYEGATKIVDFGIAKAATQSTHTQAGVLKGKYTYMSPEQAEGLPVDAKTDQFALGIVLWELLTMRRLFKRETEMMTLEAIMGGQVPRPTRFREDLPKAVDDVVMRALAKRKEDRYADCEQMANALEDALAASGVAHSQQRLAQYMRRMFADQLAEEATLGLVNPDGSLTKNFTPFTLPPPERRGDDQMEKGGTKAAPARDTDENKSDHTTADRKSAMSASKERDTGADKKKPDTREDEPKKRPSNTEPTVVEDKRKSKPNVPAPAKTQTAAKKTPKPPSRPEPTAASKPRSARLSAASLRTVLMGFVGVLLLALAVVAWQLYVRSGTGTLVVRSAQQGALVQLDGVPTGQGTPALLKGVSAGEPHKVHVEITVEGKKLVGDDVVTIPGRGETLDITIPLR